MDIKMKKLLLLLIVLLSCLYAGAQNVTNARPLFTHEGADVASATALSPTFFGSNGGNFFNVTGTTTINTIATSNIIGTEITLIFGGALTLTHSTDLVLKNNGSNITTATGDVAKFYEHAAGDWTCTSYVQADGTALVGGATIANDANNRVTTAVGDGTLNAEANLTFDGSNLGVGTSSPNGSSNLNTIGTVGIRWDYSDNNNNAKAILGTGSTTASGTLKLYRWSGVSSEFYPGWIEMNQTSGVGHLDFKVENGVPVDIGSETVTTAMSIQENGNVGIGDTSPDAQLDVEGTTEQLRLSYDGSNYFSTTVASDGGVTFEGVGTSPDFRMNDPLVMADKLTVGTSQTFGRTGFIIAAGAITLSGHSYITIDTESSAATDDLDTINSSDDNQILIIRATNDARTVVLKDGTGNLALNGDFSLDNVQDTIFLVYLNSANLWYEISRSDNGA